MKTILAILKMRTKMIFQYRAAALAGIVAQVFWGIVTTLILRAFYNEAHGPVPITLSTALTFLWIGQALLTILPWSIDKEIETQIKNGNVAYELVRPVRLYQLWFARSLAIRMTAPLLRCIPIFVVGCVFFGLEPPVSFAAGILFSISIFLAILLAATITTLVLISLFWTVSGEGIQRLLPHLVLLFSGQVVPLPLFPSWSQPFLNAQPLRGIMDIPCRIYTGLISLAEAPFYFGFQLAWSAVFFLLGQWCIRRAMRQFVIQGG